jgi:hypothetical protein
MKFPIEIPDETIDEIIKREMTFQIEMLEQSLDWSDSPKDVIEAVSLIEAMIKVRDYYSVQ